MTLNNIQEGLDALHAAFFQVAKQGAASGPSGGSGSYSFDDDVLIEKALTAKNGAKFASLWRGDTSSYNGDDSAADLGLCCLLAFWTGPDSERIDQLFRQSGLMRPKWDQRHGRATYGRMTIEKALAGCTEFYAGSSDRNDRTCGTAPASSAGAHDSPPDASSTGTSPVGKPRFDAEHVAERLAEDCRNVLAYDATYDVYRRHEGGAWRVLGARAVELDSYAVRALTHVGMARTPRNVDDALRLARRHLIRPFHQRRGLVAFANGTLEVAANALRKHRPDDLLTHAMTYDYAAGGDWTTIKGILASITPDESARAALMEHIGLALEGDTRFQHAILLIGAPGTGKTTLLRLVNMTLGQPSDQFADGNVFARDHEGQLQRAICREWPLVVLDEFPNEALRNEEHFKAMAAHGGVVSRMHNRAPVNAQWTPKLILAANDVPRFSDRSGAVRRRLLAIECPNAVQVPNLSIMDALRDELGAFAAACIIAAQDAKARGAYSVSETMTATFDELATEGDAVKAFVAECCVLTVTTGKAHEVYSGQVYKAWRAWADENGHESLRLSAIGLSKRLRDYAPWRITRKRDMAGSLLIGIGLLTPPQGDRPNQNHHSQQSAPGKAPTQEHGNSGWEHGSFEKNCHAPKSDIHARKSAAYGGYDDYGGYSRVHIETDEEEVDRAEEQCKGSIERGQNRHNRHRVAEEPPHSSGVCSDCRAPITRAYGRCDTCLRAAYAEAGEECPL